MTRQVRRRIRIRRLPPLPVRSLVEVAGLGCLVGAGFTVSAAVGLVVLGIALILAANFAGRPPSGPSAAEQR